MGWIAIEETKVLYINGFGVVLNRAVIVSAVKLLVQTCRQFKSLGNVVWPIAHICQSEGLIVNVSIQVSLLFKVLHGL